MEFYRKEIKLVFEHIGFELESDPDTGIVILRLKELCVDDEQSIPEISVYKEKNIIEVYPLVDELKEMIKAMQQILPEGDENE
ncbi:hypothetical protein [Bacillus sp. UNC438CL73TsuS30]|uniref:hypothetical protein n=1 Tax=Bacillus sp. UNC438CL73TsuS30 TaxID=1340434 RepID=UPI00047C0B7A|nr:hypothetical protein [Bacillus sp. UNC438CL73TsuS30]